MLLQLPLLLCHISSWASLWLKVTLLATSNWLTCASLASKEINNHNFLIKPTHKLLTAALQSGMTLRTCTPTLPVKFVSYWSPRILRTRHPHYEEFAYKFRKAVPEITYSSTTPPIHLCFFSSFSGLFWGVSSSRNEIVENHAPFWPQGQCAFWHLLESPC